MGKLTDILATAGKKTFSDLWNSTKAAEDYQPIPTGKYSARIISGVLDTSRNGTPCYKLTFEVCEGKYTGRRVWHDLWFTEAAFELTKRDLSKLHISTEQQLEQPIPPGIICNINVALRKEDDGTERNRITRFDVDRIEPPTVDPFEPGELA